MGNFNVRFDVALNYNDPEFRFIYVNAVGEAEVSCEGREGDAGWLCQLARIFRPLLRAYFKAANWSLGAKAKCSGEWSMFSIQ